jgi:hypothetical protein
VLFRRYLPLSPPHKSARSYGILGS